MTTVLVISTEPKARPVGFSDTLPAAVPVPVRFTVCGVEGASSLIVRVLAGVAPTVVGLYVRLMTQLFPGNTGVPTTQVVVPAATAYGNGALMDEKFRLAVWLFVTVTVFAALAVPVCSLPKASVLGETVTGIIPVPFSVTVCGLVLAVSLMVSDEAGAAPVATGLKVSMTVQLAPEATVGFRHVDDAPMA